MQLTEQIMGKPRLYDNHGREINYLRLAVTDRCNLRCFYCMPEEGIEYVDKDDLMTYEEMIRLSVVLAGMGIDKVRITGGEPFVRKDMISFLEALSRIQGLERINITTNGTLTAGMVPRLKQIGIHSVNLSLDSLDKERFFRITRRDVFDQVMQTLEELLDERMEVKVNAVVMDGKNTEDLLPLAELARHKKLGVRFIEEMPFNGSGAAPTGLPWDHRRILAFLQEHYPGLEKIPDPPFSTSQNYRIPGFEGTIGIIAAYSRTFCGSCNRLRITPQGTLKTCLYDGGVFNVRDLLRNGASDLQLRDAFSAALSHRAKDGFEAEERRLGNPVSESMSTIGG